MSSNERGMYIGMDGGVCYMSRYLEKGEHITDHRDARFQHTIVNEIDKKNDDGTRTYSLGDLLQMPRVYYRHYQPGSKLEWNTSECVKGELKKNSWDDSLLHEYYSRCGEDDNHPNMPVFIDVVDDMISSKAATTSTKLKPEVLDPSTLVCHIRVGDSGDLDDTTLVQLQGLRRRFNKCLLCLGMEWKDDAYWKRTNFKKDDIFRSFYTTCCRLLEFLEGDTRIIIAAPDDHICMFRQSRNLFVHKGGFSCLGSLICSGNVFCSRDFVAFSDTENILWRSMVIGNILPA